jgi:hypothetical protein
MSEQKWTPEPWRLEPCDLDDGSTNIVSDEPVYSNWYFTIARVGARTERRRDANAARIVQCVNALAGVADPAAEIARLRGIEKVYAAAVEECKAFRTCPQDHFSKVWSQPSMSGKHRSEFRQAIIDAADAHDTARAVAGMEAI